MTPKCLGSRAYHQTFKMYQALGKKKKFCRKLARQAYASAAHRSRVLPVRAVAHGRSSGYLSPHRHWLHVHPDRIRPEPDLALGLLEDLGGGRIQPP